MSDKELFLEQNPHIKAMLNYDKDLVEIGKAEQLSRIRNSLGTVKGRGFVKWIEIAYTRPTTVLDFYRVYLDMVVNEKKIVEIVYDFCSKEQLCAFADTAQNAFKDMNVLYPEFFTFCKTMYMGLERRKQGMFEQGKLIITLEGEPFYKISDTILAASYIIDKLRARGKIRDDMTDYEKAKVLYQWVVLHARYSAQYGNDFNTFGFFFYGLALCQSFTGAFNLLCKMENIFAIGIPGELADSAEHAPHLWSCIKVDGRHVHVDCTIGSPRFKDEELLKKYGINPELLCSWEGFDINQQDLERTHVYKNKDLEKLIDVLR